MKATYSQSLKDSIQQERALNEVFISGDHSKIVKQTEALQIVSVDADFLSYNRGNSLMRSLEKISGIQSMQIGQGFSKPMLRGLGFNRVVVLQNGIKQQGQQWGADHGLEIDQYDVEQIQIHKGAASLQYGSDAIGGAIKILPIALAEKDGYKGDISLNGASNNMLFGGSVNNYYQKDNKYIKGRITYQNFEDYNVPATDFEYLGWTYPIHNNRLKNTAGREFDFSVNAGISKPRSSSNILISNIFAKTGFFAGAHGIPSKVGLEDDGKYRNIDLPYQQVNHLKIVYNQNIKFSNSQAIELQAGYQNNNRKEYSQPHTHGIGEMPDSNLELLLKLQTLSLNASWEKQLHTASKLTLGINSEYQNNGIGGYSFLLPQFEQLIGGLYAINRLRLSEKLVLTSGIRYDQGRLHIHEYIDSNLGKEYQQRSENLTKNMGDFSFSSGISYIPNSSWTLKANLGKSFRMATANELSSNGVHHGTFCHEVGDRNLKAEKAYQVDLGADFEKGFNHPFLDKIAVNTSLFTSYFPNFIFLNPTGNFSWLPDAGQYYKYEQAKVLRAGGELSIAVEFAKRFKIESGMDYVYAQDLVSKYPIPFTPPFSVINELSLRTGRLLFIKESTFSIGHRYTAAQKRVAKNELSTPQYHLFDMTASANIPINKQDVKVIFQIQNLMNKKYYNHLSFYRSLNLPEMGRNLRLTVQFKIK